MHKKTLLIIWLLFYLPGCGAAATQSKMTPRDAKNIFMQENKWEACRYYDAESNKMVNEGCQDSTIRISSCKNDICFFQANFNYFIDGKTGKNNPWISECTMWGKLTIQSDTYAIGTAIAEYTGRNFGTKVFEDCELGFTLTGKTMQISIMSGCSAWCKPGEFEFGNTYHIDNTGGWL
jgi:hypothetical protein